MNLATQINRFLEPVRVRIRAVVQRALLSLVDDSHPMQILQVDVLYDETQGKVERVQDYGLTSNPPDGAEVILLSIGGNREQAMAIKVGHSASRVTGLEKGEVCLHTKFGQKILLKKNGDIVLDSSAKIFLGNDVLTPLAGVLTGECLDPVTGVPFPDKSSKVFARKI